MNQLITIILVAAGVALASFVIKDYIALPVYGISNGTGLCVYELDKGHKVSCPEELASRYIREVVK